MNLSLCLIISGILISSFTFAVKSENVNSKKNIPIKDIEHDPISDDEDFEGSGHDLESSGSGFGPDDEDTDRRSESFAGLPSKPSKPRVINPTLPMPTSTSTSSSTDATKAEAEPPRSFDPTKNSNSKEFDFPEKNVETDRNDNDEPPELANPNRDNVNTQNGKVDNEDQSIVNHNYDGKGSSEDDRIDNNGGVFKVNTPDRDRATSFFAQPGILAAVIGGAVVGLLCAILVVMFIVYRMRKKDEGSYPLEEMKRCPANNPYMKPNHREFFA